jgi:hypothetical protein
VLFFDCPDSLVPEIVRLGFSDIFPKSELVYLGLQIGSSLRDTRKLLIKHAERKIRAAYAIIVHSQVSLKSKLLAKLYNGVFLPHILYLTPFLDVLTHFD